MKTESILIKRDGPFFKLYLQDKPGDTELLSTRMYMYQDWEHVAEKLKVNPFVES